VVVLGVCHIWGVPANCGLFLWWRECCSHRNSQRGNRMQVRITEWPYSVPVRSMEDSIRSSNFFIFSIAGIASKIIRAVLAHHWTALFLVSFCDKSLSTVCHSSTCMKWNKSLKSYSDHTEQEWYLDGFSKVV